MTSVEIIAESIKAAMKKGMSADVCYAILRTQGYSDSDLYSAFLKVAGDL